MIPADILHNLPGGWLRLDDRGVVLAANAMTEGLTGRSGSQLLLQPFDRVLSGPSRVLYQSYLQPLLRLHGNVAELALTLKLPDGELREVLVYSQRSVGDGAPAGVDVLMVPIRQRRRIEDELLRIKRAADLAPGLIFQLQVDADGRTTFPYVSEAVRRLYGTTPEAARASASAVFDAVLPDDRAALLDGLSAAAAADRDWTASFRVRGSDGVPRWHEVHAGLRRLAPGIQLWSGHITDITEQRALEDMLVERQTIERLHRARSDFLARVSHELRTPLNGILGFAQLLLQEHEAPLDARQRDRVEVIRHAGDHLLQLINQLLDIGRVEAGELALPCEPVALDDALAHALRVVAPAAAAHGVHLPPAAAGPAGLRVQANDLRLQQVLVNVLGNAVKYNRPGGEVGVDLQLDVVAGCVRVAVRDTGPGFTAAQREALFQPFNRLGAERGPVEGSGLGLAISRQLLTLMGGSIEAEGEPGIGAVFTLVLPLAAPGAALAPLQVAAPGPVLAPVGPRASGRVLYVEDNAVNAMLFEALCGQRPDVRLQVVNDGESALRAAAHVPDLLLLDMQLPDTDGPGLLQALRRLPALARVPAIAVSAAARPEDLARAKAAGFDDYWTKPLDLRQTLAALDRWLARGAVAGAS